MPLARRRRGRVVRRDRSARRDRAARRVRASRVAAVIEVGPSRYEFTPGAAVEVRGARRARRFRRGAGCAEARWDGDAADFELRIAPARTFALARDLDELAAGGLARHVDPGVGRRARARRGPPRGAAVLARRTGAPQAARPDRRPLPLRADPRWVACARVRPGHAANAAACRACARRGHRRRRLMFAD